jgi:cation transporter-like permease
MAVPWGLLTFVIGILYGALSRGRQDKSQLFKQGLVIGLVLALVLVVIGVLTGAPALGIGGAFGIIIAAIVLSLLFILGVWIGDLITSGRDRRAVRP